MWCREGCGVGRVWCREGVVVGRVWCREGCREGCDGRERCGGV